MAICFWWLGTIYTDMKEQSEALKSLDQALAIYQELGMTDEVNGVQKRINTLKG